MWRGRREYGKGVKMEVVRAADENAPIVKALFVPAKDTH